MNKYLATHIKTKKHFFVNLYRQYDKISSKEIIFDMSAKTQHKFDKCLDFFRKINRDFFIYKENTEMIFNYLDKGYNRNDLEYILTLFVIKYIVFSQKLLSNEIEICKNMNQEYKSLAAIKRFLDIEVIYCFLFWCYSFIFTEQTEDHKNEKMHRREGSDNLLSISHTLNQSSNSNSLGKLADNVSNDNKMEKGESGRSLKVPIHLQGKFQVFSSYRS